MNSPQPLPPTQPLTIREQEVLTCIGEGLSNREIAAQLTVAMSTAKWYVRQIYNKLGVENRKQAIARAHQLNLLPEKQEPSPSLGRLPLQPTPFIGRKHNLQELAALITDPKIKLITILGPGGMGKTRLSIEVARGQAGAFADGVYFVSLAALDDPNLIVTAVANAINFSFHMQDQREKEQLLAYLKDKQLMLVLDNFEHLLAGLPFIADILQVAAGVKILATSRERLRLRGETVYLIGNMFVPKNINKETTQIAETHDALQLFVTNARRMQPKFALTADNLHDVVHICQLVDGLPLGIELAAAWIGLLTPSDIGAEIKTSLDFLASNLLDTPGRQQSIRSVFESSWKQLTALEQCAFQKLSVFRGGFTRKAAAAVAGTNLPMLMTLVNKSLVSSDGYGRYHLHELLRQYGQEKLQEAGETASTRDQHLAFFLTMVQNFKPQLWGMDQAVGFNRIESDLDNFRAAIEWSRIAQNKVESGLNLARLMTNFWVSRTYFEEGRMHLSMILSQPNASGRTVARAKALHAAGFLAFMQSDYPVIRPLLEESLSIYQELGLEGERDFANGLILLGDMESQLGDYVTAVTLTKEALAIVQALADKAGIARVLWQLGACVIRSGKYEEAAQYFEQSLALMRQLDNKGNTALALSSLAEVLLRQGNYKRATQYAEEGLALRRELNDTWGISVSLANIAWIALRQDDLVKAVTLLGESLTLRRKIGEVGGIAWCLEKLAEIALISGQRSIPPERESLFKRAAQLFGGAAGLRAPVNSTIDLVDQPEYERQVAAVQAQLDEAQFTVAWAAGHAMTLEQAIDFALTVKSASHNTVK